MSNPWQDFWNERFAANETLYGPFPNEYFKAFIDRQPAAGRLLLPAEGEGRHARYAARRGWQVDAFDFSEAALDKARRLSDAEGLSIHYWLQDVRFFKAPPVYDAVALIYAHFPPSIRVPFHQAIRHCVKPGGWVLLEAFRPEQLSGNFPSGGPRDPEMLYTSAQLQDDFAGWTFLECYDTIVNLQEGPFHQGEGAVVRLLAQKPEQADAIILS